MKLVDIYFWQKGFEEDIQKQKDLQLLKAQENAKK
jgi:hypothetical protein